MRVRLTTAKLFHGGFTPSTILTQEPREPFQVECFFSANTLNVTTQEVHCHDYFMFGLNNSDYSASVYAVTFWVTGPKGVIP